MEAGVNATAVVGRERELGRVRSFLDRVATVPASLELAGEPGVGKTVLWQAGVEAALERRRFVLRARPAEAERDLTYSGLGDLLAPALGRLEALSAPRRRALEIALLIAADEDAEVDARAVGLATLDLLRLLARDGPLVVAIDDTQWLDPASRQTLAYALRRLEREPVSLLTASRPDAESLARGQLARLVVGPLSVGALHELLRSRVNVALTRPTLVRVHETSGGNPFFALELVSALAGRALRPGEPLPVPATLTALTASRFEHLDPPARDVLLYVAALAHPTRETVTVAAGEHAGAALEAAEAAGLVEAAGARLRFTHPLLGSVHYGSASRDERARVHRRLAEVVTDAEERGRHLGAATTVPDGEVAAALDRAAEVARRRGAAASAAALAEHAARLTPPVAGDDVARRTIAAAEWWMDAGDTRRCLALIEPVLTTLPSGPLRLAALSANARAVEDRRDHRRLLEDAVAEAEGYAENQAPLLFQLCYALIHALEFDAARERAHVAVRLAEQTGDPTLEVFALSMAGRLDVGSGGLELLHRARDRERDTVAFDAYQSPATWLGWWLLANDELPGARRILAAQHRKAVDDGDYWSQTFLHWPLTEVECRAGNYEEARAYAEAGAKLAEQSDDYALSMFLCCRALAAAHTGDSATARACAEESLAAARAMPSELFTVRPRIALAFLAVSEARYADALQHLEGLPELALNGPYWTTYPFWGDLFDALVSMRELERARSLLADLDARRHVVERPGAAPMIARCRGLVLAASGSVEKGIASLDEALRLHDTRPAPLERARTLLALGEIQRRANRRLLARETLQTALTSFESLGARLWADRTKREIARIGGRAAAAGGELSETERQIAELVGEGRSNKEVAAALSLSPKTVEWNLSKVYAKLGVRSRTELARRLT
jgi:DNA-binding CsgD family transcriptional regulator